MIDASGTSFHNDTLVATATELQATFGEADYWNNTGEDKVNLEWVLQTAEGDVFTIYDWKTDEPLDLDRRIEWHIGARSKAVSAKACSLVKHLMGRTV